MSRCFPAALLTQGPVSDSPAMEQRVDATVAKLTLEQKLELIGGVPPGSRNGQPVIVYSLSNKLCFPSVAIT